MSPYRYYIIMTSFVLFTKEKKIFVFDSMKVVSMYTFVCCLYFYKDCGRDGVCVLCTLPMGKSLKQ